ncbi:hypothetical protein GHT09_013718 [Marmota monax]|uniref:Peptidase S1 domain-containing protein n=1 Tax=Marmota monax TaxID=9995 RepID=A0A834UWW7_MARMO|nr:hypothetical protein GHT09_013718 [Marmota monax]
MWGDQWTHAERRQADLPSPRHLVSVVLGAQSCRARSPRSRGSASARSSRTTPPPRRTSATSDVLLIQDSQGILPSLRPGPGHTTGAQHVLCEEWRPLRRGWAGGRVPGPHSACAPQLDRPASLGTASTQGTQCLAMGWGRLGTRVPTPRALQELNTTVVTFLCTLAPGCSAASASYVLGGCRRASAGGGVAGSHAPLAVPPGGASTGTQRPRYPAGGRCPQALSSHSLILGTSHWPRGLASPFLPGRFRWPPGLRGILQGLDSFLIRECATRQYPDFFPRVSLYVDWIHSVLPGQGAPAAPGRPPATASSKP